MRGTKSRLVAGAVVLAMAGLVPASAVGPAAAQTAAAPEAAAPTYVPGVPQPAAGGTETGTAETTEVIVGDNDNRTVAVHVRSSQQYSPIGTLVAQFPGGQSAPCTGFLVFNNTVATAAHCLYDRDSGHEATFVIFHPAVADDQGAFQCIANKPANIIVPQAYIRSGDVDDDLGVIKANCTENNSGTPVNPIDYTGWYGFTPVDRYGQLVGLAGYPSQVRGANTEDTMYVDENRVVKTEAGQITYKMDASTGQSGAPIFDHITAPTVPQTGWYAIGIHSGGGRIFPGINKRNWGARIAGANYQRLYNWCLKAVA